MEVSRQVASKWETGGAGPDLNKLLTLADALEISLDALCGQEAGPATATSGSEGSASRKHRWLLPFLCRALMACLLAGGLWAWIQRNIVPAEETRAESTLPETFTVSGAGFRRSVSTLSYQFIPSAVGTNYTYQIAFTGEYEPAPQVFETACVGGVCAGTVELSATDLYTVTVLVSDVISSRSAAIAKELLLDENTVCWEPLS